MYNEKFIWKVLKYTNCTKKKQLRSSIFFLLLCVDPETSCEYTDVNINECFKGLLYRIAGLNKLLSYPVEIVTVMSLLQRAMDEYSNLKENFDLDSYHIYRKLILDAGSEVSKIKEV